MLVWPGTVLPESDDDEFQAFLKKEFDIQHPVKIHRVITKAGLGGPGGREDLCFRVADADVMKFATPHRLHVGIRWYSNMTEEVEKIYPAEFLERFPPPSSSA